MPHGDVANSVSALIVEDPDFSLIRKWVTAMPFPINKCHIAVVWDVSLKIPETRKIPENHSLENHSLAEDLPIEKAD